MTVKTVRRAFPLALYLISPLVLALAGVIFFVIPFGYSSYATQSQSQSWPTVEGTILKSSLTSYESPSRDGNSSTPMYNADIRTRYQIKGVSYQIIEVYKGQSVGGSSTYRTHANLLRRFPKGAIVNVYYDPSEPSSAVLLTEVQTKTYVVIIGGAILAIFALYLFILAIMDTVYYFNYKLKQLKIRRLKRNS